jgi:hypothetical protein
MGYQSKSKSAEPRPVIATRSGRRPKQDLKSMPGIKKPTPQEKHVARKEAASKVAIELATGVNYEPAQPAPVAAAKRSHKKATAAAVSVATPKAVYRCVDKMFGIEAHSNHKLISFRRVHAAMSDRGVSGHSMAKKLYLRYIVDKHAKYDALPWTHDNKPPVKFLDQKRLVELYELGHSTKEQAAKWNFTAWEGKVNEARLRQAVESGMTNVSLETLNDHVAKPDERTLGKLIGWLAPESCLAAPQAAGRADAKAEPRNMITLAAVAYAEFRDTAPDVIFSTDMFTVFISEKGVLDIVYMPAGSLAKLKEHNLRATIDISAAGIKEIAKARASIPSYATFSATGDVLSIVLLFIDRGIPAPEKYYHIYPIDGHGKGKAAVLSSKTFVAMLPADFIENIILWQIWAQIILPKTAHLCEELAKAVSGDYASIGRPSVSRSVSQSRRESSGAAASSSARSVPGGSKAGGSKVAAPPPPPSCLDNGDSAAFAALVDERVRNMRREEHPASPPKRARFDDPVPAPRELARYSSPIHCMDGDCPQIAVLMDGDKMRALGLICIQELCKKRYVKLKWRFIKFAAGCSMIQSPNDVSPVHNQVKSQTGVKADFRGKDWEVDEDEIDCHMRLFDQVVMTDGVGKGVDKTRERAIMGYICNSRKIFSRAFNAVDCCKGWKLAGLFPLNLELILSKWDGWTSLDPAQGKLILESIPALAEIIRTDGRLDDKVLTEKFPFLPPPLVGHLAAMSWVRDRAVVLSCEGYGSSRAAAEPVLSAAKAAQKQKSTEKKAQLPVTLQLWCEICKYVTKDVAEAQLRLREIPFKKGDTKESMLTQWREHDELAARVALRGGGGGGAAQQRQSPRRGGGGAAGGGVGGAASPRGRERSRSR